MHGILKVFSGISTQHLYQKKRTYFEELTKARHPSTAEVAADPYIVHVLGSSGRQTPGFFASFAFTWTLWFKPLPKERIQMPRLNLIYIRAARVEAHATKQKDLK